VQQRQAVQQRRGVQARRTQQRARALQRQHATLRQQQRVWQRTAAKRAARQLETEEAILEREARLRAIRTEPPSYGRERESYEGYVRRRTAEARVATLAAADRAATLDGIWRAALASPLHVSFGSLRRRATAAPFDANGLDLPLPEPRPEDYQPGAANLPEWVPGQRAARERARAAAYAAYRQAVADHRAAEFSRVRRLSVARLEHQRREAAARAEVDAHNAAVDRLQAGYREREPAAVEEFARIVLSSRAWPEGVVLHWRLRYRPGYRQIDAECGLPEPAVVPSVRRYRYVAAVDAIRRQFAPVAEVRERYNGLVEQIALTAMFDLFSGLAPAVVDVVQLNGRAAGGAVLVSLAVARAEWDALRPWDQAPRTLLERLDARVSPDAHGGAPVVPWADLDAD
jgi:restriction system protein